ncbi:ribokinase [Cohaesibacter haloalkalitolerans]|uniref:ribokinase n=1 Tax=Cohaesibacter haloalkalitolerans TaxID=1162980 RepID=UPI000E65CE67|nr:ribokinase [Cohaesibacter haloalkalitolerans]
MSITVFGSVNLDLTVSVHHLPIAGETSHAAGFQTGLGGKGANQAVAATRLAKCPVKFVAAVGEDSFADKLRADLQKMTVDTANLVTMKGAESGIALIHVDQSSQNSITVVGGANMAWPDAGPCADVFKGCKVALFQLETPIPATLAAMRAARAAGAVVILDPAPIAEGHMEALIAEADIVTPNETETAAITGTMPGNFLEAQTLAKSLVAMGPKVAIVKLGAKGLAYASRHDGEGVIKPYFVKAIDTVAAGDSFNGGLAAALAEGWSLQDALKFAAAAGALATTRRGAGEAVPSRQEVDDLVAAN